MNHDGPKADSHQHLQDALAHLEQELARAPDGPSKAELLASIGRLYEEALGQIDQALFHYRRSLDYEPRQEKAVDGMVRILGQQSRHREQEEVLRQAMAVSGDRLRTAKLQIQLGTLYLEKLNRPDLAMTALEQVLDADPLQKSVYPILDRLYREKGDWTAVLKNASAWLDLTQDRTLAVAIMNTMAEVWLDSLQESERAREILEEVLLIDAENIQALRNLERLVRRAGKLDELTTVLERQVGLLAFRHPQEQVRLALELADLYLNHFSEPDRAEGYLRKILTLDPIQPRARELLAQLHEAKANWSELLAVYEADLRLVTDAGAKAERLSRIAEITEKHLGRGEQATQLYRDAYATAGELGPGDAGLQELRLKISDNLIRRLREESHTEELRAFFDEQVAGAKSVGEKAQGLKNLLDLGDRENLEGHALSLIELARTLPQPGQNELRAFALRKLAVHYLTMERWKNLVDVYQDQLALIDAPADQSMVFFRMGEIQSQRLNLPEEAARSYREALERNPSLTPALRALREILVQLERYREAVDLLQTEVSLTTGGKARSALYLQIGSLREDHLHEGETAVRDFEQALALDPENDKALRRLAVQTYQTEQWAKAEPLFERMAERLDDDDSEDSFKRAAFWSRRARIAEKLDHLEEAVDFLREALQSEKSFVPAFEQLGEIFYRLHKWPEARSAYQQYLQFARTRKDATESSLVHKAYLALARIEDHLGNEAESIRYYKKVLEAEPFQTEALEALINLQSKAQNWAEVQNLYDSLLRRHPEGEDWMTIQFAKAEVWESRLQRPKNAIACYREILERDPLHSLALEKLAQLYCSSGELDEGIAILERLVRGETDPKRLVQYLYSLGRVHRIGKKDLKAAEEQYRQILVQRPDDLGALKELSEIFQALKSYGDLAQVYQQILAVMKKSDPLMAIPFYLKLGNLYRRELEDPAQAITSFKSVIDIDPNNVGARNALVEIYASHESYHEEAIRQHRKLLQSDPLRVASYRSIAEIYMQRKEYDKAYCLYRVLESLGEARPEEVAFLAKCFPALGTQLRSEISDSLRHEVLTHPAEKNLLTDVLRVLREPLRELFWDPAIAEKTEAPLGPFGRQMAECIDQISPILQIPKPDLRIVKKSETLLSPVGGLDSLLLVSSGFMSGSFGIVERFRLIRVLDSFVAGREWAWRFQAGQLERLFLVMMKFFYPELEVGNFPERELKEDLKRFKKVFPKKMHGPVKDLLSQVARSWEQFNFASWMDGVRQTGNRVALLLVGEFEAALRITFLEEGLAEALGRDDRSGLSRIGAAARSARLRDLLFFATSEEYFRLRARLGKALQPGRLQLS